MDTGGNNNSNSIIGCLDDDDIWGDADFIEQAVRDADFIEQAATQFSHFPQKQQPPPTTTTAFNFSPPRQLSQRTSHITTTLDPFDSFAPPPQHHQIHTINKEVGRVPKQLSQVTNHSADGFVDSFVPPPQLRLDKELEIDMLKKELGRVSNQLNLLEKECSDLRKEKEQLKGVDSRVEEKVAEKYREKSKNLIRFVPSSTDPGTSRVCPDTNQPNNSVGWTKSCNSIGVQTDEATAFRSFRGSQELLDVWYSSDEERGKSLVEKLLTDCGTEISVLFGYITSGISYESNMTSEENATKLIEIEKVSLLYSEWTKISNEGSGFKDLVKALVDLSSLENFVIVHSSLRILHVALLNSFSMGKNFDKRENVTVEEPLSEKDESEINRCGYSGNETLFLANMTHILNRGNNPSGLRLLSNVKTSSHGGFFSHDRFAESLSGADWAFLFERICQIAMKNNYEKIRVEALSIMNLILTRQNAYLERHEFVGEQLFQNLANLLRKDAGFCVQDLAVHTLYLLCNCPKVVAMLCSGLKKDAADHSSSSVMKEKTNVELLDNILIGLADCLACSGTATSEEMNLRRNAIMFLAFLASSGQSGFEILLNHSLPEDTNFLAIIVQSLISDMELETTKQAQLSNIVREQNLLIREALILLNRLASNQKYYIPVLQALTNTRDMASMTVDLANRLTGKSSKVVSRQKNSNQTTKQTLESEVMDLARGFKKRVFTYLGDSIS